MDVIKQQERTVSSKYVQFFAALRHPNFRLLWAGTMFLHFGTMMQMLAWGWLVLELTDSPFWLGLLGFSRTAPMLVFSLVGGVAADRIGKRTVVLAAQTANLVLTTILAALTVAGLAQPWHVIGIVLLCGVAMAFNQPSYQALFYDVVGKDDLLNAVALNSAMQNLTRIGAPALGGVLVGVVGIGGVLSIIPVSYLGIIGALLLMKGLPSPGPAKQAAWRDLMDVFRYIRGDRTVAGLIFLETIPGLFALPYMTILPIFARDILGVGAPGYGLLMSAAGAGALLGSVTLAAIGHTRFKGLLMIGAIASFGFFLVVFAASTWFPLSLAMLVGAGGADTIYIYTINVLLQTMSPDALRGRVMSVFTLADTGLTPIGSIQVGAVAAALGAPLALGASGVIVICLATGVALRVPRLRTLA